MSFVFVYFVSPDAVNKIYYTILLDVCCVSVLKFARLIVEQICKQVLIILQVITCVYVCVPDWS